MYYKNKFKLIIKPINNEAIYFYSTKGLSPLLHLFSTPLKAFAFSTIYVWLFMVTPEKLKKNRGFSCSLLSKINMI